MLKRCFLAAMVTASAFGANAAEPDFSDVDSLAKARQLAEEGKLEKLHLMPLDLGGQDVPMNVVYVPVGIAQAKARLDGTVRKMLEDGSVSKYAATPEYKGKSFVPARISIKAWHPDKPASFNPTLNVW